MARKPTLLNLDLIKAMIVRREFIGTRYTELQMAGEPTIHPQLADAIMLLRSAHVKVGLSTHGLNMHKVEVRRALLALDALTISVDSVNPEVYAKMRTPGRLEDLVHNIRLLMTDVLKLKQLNSRVPLIDLQVVKSPIIQGSGNLQALQKFVYDNGWDQLVRCRSVDDSFMEMDGRMPIGSFPRPEAWTKHGKPCERPFNRVSINQDGDVVSCCFIFDPKKDSVNYYGNLHHQDLRTIWQGPRAVAMRETWENRALRDECTKCYQFSEHDVHQDIIREISAAQYR